MAKVCTSDAKHHCEHLEPAVRQRQAELLKKTAIATGCMTDMAPPSMHNVWFSTDAHVATKAKKVAGALWGSHFSALSEKITAPDGPKSDPAALAKWYVVPGSAHALDSGSDPASKTPAEKALSRVAHVAGFKQCSA